MPRYHISPMTGNPVACKAKIQCPFGDMNADHYDSRNAALEAYEKKNKDKTFTSYEDGKIRVSNLPEGMRIDDNTILLPKGVYAIGDPIYTAGVDEDAWDSWVDTVAAESNGKELGALGATYNNYPVIAMPTEQGSGLYGDSFGRTFEITSGVFGVTPVSLLKKMGIDDESIMESSSIVTFDEPFIIQNQGGVLKLGEHMNLYTDQKIEDDDDDDAHD